MIVTLRRVVLEVPMMVVVVVGVRGDGELVVRRGGGQMNRRRRRSLLLLDAQMPDVGSAAMLMLMMVMRRDAAGRFRPAGAVLDGGAHRAYDQRRFDQSRRLLIGRPPIARGIPRDSRFRDVESGNARRNINSPRCVVDARSTDPRRSSREPQCI